MGKKNIEETVTDIVTPIVEKNSCELVDVEFVKEGANWYLRTYIDKPGGVTLDDCQAVSEALSAILDETDPIQQSYYMEVSSPGLERALKKDKDFIRYIGENIEVRLFKTILGKKLFEGKLREFSNNKVVIETEEGNIMNFDRTEISLAKRIIKI